MHLVSPKAPQKFNLSPTTPLLSMHLVTPKPLKNSTFQHTLSLQYASPYTKSTDKSQTFTLRFHFRIHHVTPKVLNRKFLQEPPPLGIHLVTRKALNNLNFTENAVTWLSIALHRKHSKISTFPDTLSLGYASRYTKTTEKYQHFKIRSHLGIHRLTPKPLKNLNF